jgi:hypothetical protein
VHLLHKTMTHTDNSETLVNAFKRIEELEAQCEGWRQGQKEDLALQVEQHQQIKALELQRDEALTDDELLAILKSVDPATQRLPSGFKQFARAIEAAIWSKT